MIRAIFLAMLCCFGQIANCQSARAEVKLPAVFGSHMVMQREMKLPIWGTAESGEKITVRWDDQEVGSATADSKGNWRVELEPLKADEGQSHRLTVAGKNSVAIEDVLIGEVWIGSGQSNMARSVGKTDAAEAKFADIRLLQVPAKLDKKPLTDIDAHWQNCTPDTAADFSAVLYHFGQRLHKELKVPIGLVNASRGSTAIQQFMPPPKPGPLYNGAIAPLAPMAIRGVVWYQGEANVSTSGLDYAPQFKTMVEGWRKEWRREIPFYFVQLAPLKNYADGTLPPLWEAQTAGLKLPHTGMAVTTDLAGNMSNIHPQNKKDVGYRLALWALAKDYGVKNLEYSGPLYKSMAIDGNKIRLKFTHAKGLKSRDDKPLAEFQIAGADDKFVAGQATVEGETIFVQSTQIEAPVKVRFAWSNAPSPNLVNAAGLPAAPFHTDDWQGGADE